MYLTCSYLRFQSLLGHQFIIYTGANIWILVDRVLYNQLFVVSVKQRPVSLRAANFDVFYVSGHQ